MYKHLKLLIVYEKMIKNNTMVISDLFLMKMYVFVSEVHINKIHNSHVLIIPGVSFWTQLTNSVSTEYFLKLNKKKQYR